MHTITKLYTASFDFPIGNKKPEKTYMLATIPRSGSTYFAIRLWQSGIFGAPMEYLNFPIMGNLLNRLGFESNASHELNQIEVLRYWGMVQERRTSKNGVFGYKMFMNNFLALAKFYPDLLTKISPDFVIYLVRESALDQAISYSRAIRSKVWFAETKKTKHIEYSASHIRYCLKSIEEQRVFWEDAFKLTGISPIRVSYESFLRSEHSTLSTIAKTVGISYRPENKIAIPEIEKQDDEFNSVWKARFLEESGRESRASK